MSTVEQKTPPSFCVACDAAEGQCSHTGARYHESWFEYQTAPGSGKIRPEYSDWFQENPWSHSPEERSEPKPRSLSGIRQDLVPWVFFNEGLDARLQEAYERNPHQTGLCGSNFRQSLEAGKIDNPNGALYAALGKIK